MRSVIDNPVLYNILKILANSEMPLGAKSISEKLQERGFNVKKETVQYYLRMLDELGMTCKRGMAGRTISEKGLEELKKGMIRERIGSFIELREEYAYNANLDLERGRGLVSLNVGIVHESDFTKSLKLIKRCVDSGLAMSPLVKIYEKDRDRIRLNDGEVGIGLVSTSVIDAALIGNRIGSTPT
ncbi:NrpR regulatory domain-containing protein, partial [Geoglobus sp.]